MRPLRAINNIQTKKNVAPNLMLNQMNTRNSMAQTKIYEYSAFGILIQSEILLPALSKKTTDSDQNAIYIKIGKVPGNIKNEAPSLNKNIRFSKTEFLFQVPEKIKIYVSNGSLVILETFNSRLDDVLLYFYSNGLAAALYQRGVIPFHVSGVFLNKNKVLLIAAKSGTGKSTTAINLQEKGYPVFTDDTAILHKKDNKVFATASYPMIRLWQKSFENQNLFDHNQKQRLLQDVEFNKYGFSFHNDFSQKEHEVLGIVFIEIGEEEIEINTLSKIEVTQQLINNTYRKYLVKGMQMEETQFRLISEIANTIPSYMAKRPINKETFGTFAGQIVSEICNKLV